MRRAVLAIGCILSALVALKSGQAMLVPAPRQPLPPIGYQPFFGPYPYPEYEYEYPFDGNGIDPRVAAGAGVLGGAAFLFLMLFIMPLFVRTTVDIIGGGGGASPPPPVIVTPPSSG